jgi:transposase-like protein
MKYSKRLKGTALWKILPSGNRSVSEVALEMGISEQTIYNWKTQAENSILFLEDTGSPLETGQLEQYNNEWAHQGRNMNGRTPFKAFIEGINPSTLEPRETDRIV